MNFLAHLYLADIDDHHRLGNLAGDWIKGRLERQVYPGRVLAGARRHRFVDGFADHHPAALVARESLGPERRRAAGIILDVVNDYFLTRHWSLYSDESLPAFIAAGYASLERTRADWPEQAQPVLQQMISHDWLNRYTDLAAVARTLERIGGRMRRDPGLADSLRVLEACHEPLERQFHAVISDLRKACASDSGQDRHDHS